MRYNEIIKEVEPIRDIEPGNHISVMGGRDKIGKKTKKLPGNNPYTYEIVKNHNEITIYLFDSRYDELIGKLLIENIYFPLKNAGTVDYITVHKNYTGYGLAKSLYGIYLSILKRPLVSGNMQTPGGRRNWLSLSKIPGVEVRGYIKIHNYEFDEYREIGDKKIEAIMRSGAQYMGEDSRGDHYFGFDVEAGDKQMAAVVKAVNLYSQDADITYDIGMYAVWSGA